MKVQVASEAALSPNSSAEQSPLDGIEGPTNEARVALVSGRTYEIVAGADADRLVVHGRGGEVVLRIQITDEGPVLAFQGATIALEASRAIDLDAKTIRVRARDTLMLESGGDMVQSAGGHHQTEAAGDARIAAANVEVQAGQGHLELLAEGRVSVDGEHVGLNDKPIPTPFPWSREARDS